MDYKQRQTSLIEEYNKNQQLILQASQRNQQIVGQLQLIEEALKEGEAVVEVKTAGDK